MTPRQPHYFLTLLTRYLEVDLPADVRRFLRQARRAVELRQAKDRWPHGFPTSSPGGWADDFAELGPIACEKHPDARAIVGKTTRELCLECAVAAADGPKLPPGK